MRPINMLESDYLLHREEYNGICLDCKAIKWGEVEPDAENYTCDDCGKDRVIGIENALIMGLLNILGDHES